MITVLFWILIGVYAIAFVILNILKFRNKNKKTKIAFFHPFWYLISLTIVMMVEEDKKYYGV